MVKTPQNYYLSIDDFHLLFSRLTGLGYTIIAPKIVEGNFTYSPLTSPAELPRGWTARQEAGLFRLEKRADEAFFGYTVGQHSWKPFLLPSEQTVWTAERQQEGWHLYHTLADSGPQAFLGVRACDLAALEVLDRVFLRGNFVEPTYAARRSQTLVIAVNCTQAGGTCFCASLGTGPRAVSGFDLALTEVLQDGRHFFVAEAGSDRGAALLAAVAPRPASPEEAAAATQAVAQAARDMGRHLETDGLQELLYRNYEHPRWADVAGRCLTCGNCAMICPTCFCHTYEDSLDLEGRRTERRRRQQVCFTLEFSYLHGGSVRASSLSRYRQWLTHKLAHHLVSGGH